MRIAIWFFKFLYGKFMFLLARYNLRNQEQATSATLMPTHSRQVIKEHAERVKWRDI